MIYTALTKKAMKLVFDAHRDQIDKSGLPYIYHAVHVAEQMKDEATTCVALLHDVIEDTDTTAEQLTEMGFPEEVVEAVKQMTHDKSVPYMDYVAEIKKNPIAKAVKLADLAHNSDLTRLDQVTEADLERVQKYKKAMALLKDEPEA